MRRRIPQGKALSDTLLRHVSSFDPCFEPLVAAVRGQVVESVHRGAIAIVDSRGLLLGGVGDPGVRVHLRSAAKPFQALAVVESGAADAWAITQAELALMCGSHAGEPEHVKLVTELLARLGVPLSALVCGSPRHMCSGKHAGMITLALHLGVAVEGYEREEHAVQQEVAATIRRLLARRSELARGEDPPGSAELAGPTGPAEPSWWPGPPGRLGLSDLSQEVTASPPTIFAGIDGCGVPVVRLALSEGAWLYALLGAGATPELARVRDAMLAHPELVAGDSLMDTQAMRAASGRMLTKGGAEGVEGVAAMEEAAAAHGYLIKVEDGSSRMLPALVGLVMRVEGLEAAAEVFERQYPQLGAGWGAGLSGAAATTVGGAALADAGARGGGDGRWVVIPSPGELLRHKGRGSRRERERTGGRFFPVAGHGLDDLMLGVRRGNEKEILRFLRDEWPRSDEETFGQAVEWVADPFALVFKSQKRIVAVLKGHFVGGLASVDELIVREGQRGMGLGTSLLERFEAEAAQRGCTRVVLRAVKGSRAEDFYRDHGYHRECVQYSYEFGYDYIRLTRELRSP